MSDSAKRQRRKSAGATETPPPISPPSPSAESKRSRFELVVVSVYCLEFFAECLMDTDLVALMRVSRLVHGAIGSESRGALAAAVWWTRYRRQYELWSAYVTAKRAAKRAKRRQGTAPDETVGAKFTRMRFDSLSANATKEPTDPNDVVDRDDDGGDETDEDDAGAGAEREVKLEKPEKPEKRMSDDDDGDGDNGRYAFERVSAKICASTWRYTKRNWAALGQEPHATWCVQYRSYMIASMGVSTRFALVDCDTHRLHCWLPYRTWDDPHVTTSIGDRRDAAQRRMRRHAVRAQRWVDRHASVYASADAVAGPIASIARSEPPSDCYLASATLSRADTPPRRPPPPPPPPPPSSSPSTPPPHPIEHAHYLTAEQRARIPHVPFVYAPNRIHCRNPSAAWYMEAVEAIGFEAKIAAAHRRVRGGTAFCVHAVHMYGLDYQSAVADIETDHCRSIAAHAGVGDNISLYGGDDDGGGDGDRKYSGLGAPTAAAAAASVGADGNDGDSEKAKLDEALTTLRAHVARTRADHTRAVVYRRRDAPRQVDMSAEWGAESGDWPLSRNLCDRRVSAMYLRGLYCESQIETSTSSGFKDRHYSTHWAVVERLALDSVASWHETFGYECWPQNFLVQSSADLTAELEALDAREPDRIADQRHEMVEQLMKAVRHAMRQSLVLPFAVAGAYGDVACRTVLLDSVLLPFPVFCVDRAWMPFDTRRTVYVCRLCAHRRMQRVTGFDAMLERITTDAARRAGTDEDDDEVANYCQNCLDIGDPSCRRPPMPLPGGVGTRNVCDAGRRVGDFATTAPIAKARLKCNAKMGGSSGTSGDIARNDRSNQPAASLADIRRRRAYLDARRGWCAPVRAVDTFCGTIGAYGQRLKLIISGPFRGLVAFRS